MTMDLKKQSMIREVQTAAANTIRLASMPIPSVQLPNFRNYHLADNQYEIIMEEILTFQDKLDDDHEIAIALANFGNSYVVNVSRIGYRNPDILIFWGTLNGSDVQVQLMQHVNQLSFLLMAVPKEDKSKPARRIGFVNYEDDSSKGDE